jgi:hypothetical protein
MNTLAREEQERTAMMEAIQSKTAKSVAEILERELCRLRDNRNTEPQVSVAAAAHGRVRFAQGYSLSMLVEESRILEVTIFGTLQRRQSELDRNQVRPDAAIIADEADRQLEETVFSFLVARAAAIAPYLSD